MIDDIEEIWQEDIQNKKKNSFFKKPSRGGRKSMRTAFDFMTRKEKLNLNGKVSISHMYDLILPKEEFFQLEKEEQKNMLQHWRDKYPNTQIMKEMGIANATLARVITDLEIPKKRTYRKAAKQKETTPIPAAAPFERKILDTPNISGLQLNYNGVYTSEELSRIWTKLQLLTETEENSFAVSISIQEKKE